MADRNHNRGESRETWYTRYFGPDYLKIDIQRNTPAEVEFLWRALDLAGGRLYCDIACGYGRHLVPLVERGANAVGVDLSETMLTEAARQLGSRSRRLVRADYRRLPFGGVFDTASIMFNSFGYCADDQDNFAVLKAVHASLKPGGLFLLDLTNRDYFLKTISPREWFENGDAVILEKKWYDPLRNRSEIDVSVVDKQGKRDYHHSIRLYSATELTLLLEAAGFTVLSIWGGFSGEEYTLESSRMIILSQSSRRGCHED